MSRSYRWNLEYAAAAEPERCQFCHEFAATVELRIRNTWGGERSDVLCDDCMEHVHERLVRKRVQHSLVRLNTGDD